MKRKKSRAPRNPFHVPRSPQPDPEPVAFPMRLNKFIAKAGVCSRRKAVDLVKAGRIKVNGQIVREPFHLVKDGDQVEYEGRKLAIETTRVYYLLNKPKNVITTTADEKGRKTVLDLIQDKGALRLFPVGRLDRQTTGLLVITNDGDLAKKLAHPSHQVRKQYLVRLDKPLDPDHFAQISAGLQLADGPAPIKELDHPKPEDRSTVSITLFIGRNRIVRRIFEHMGYRIKSLDRIHYAGLTKKNLPRGRYRPLTPREVIMLKHFI